MGEWGEGMGCGWVVSHRSSRITVVPYTWCSLVVVALRVPPTCSTSREMRSALRSLVL